MGETVHVFAYDAQNGKLNPMQVVSTLPKDYTGTNNTTAEVVVHPNGKFLYVSNRGHDSIANFTIGDDGRLTPRGFASTQGEVPRNFAIAPGGQFLLAANQKTDNIVVFSIDQATGDLKPTGAKVDAPAPICIRFLSPAK
jgi:6-phosphogluconolactonase